MSHIHAQGIIFDMDGLLVDSEPAWFEAEVAFVSARGGEWTEALAAPCVGAGLPKTLLEMAKSTGHEPSPALDLKELEDRFLEHLTRVQIKAGAQELIARAKARVPIAVGSSSPSRLVRAVLAHTELLANFDHIVCGDEVAAPKPEPLIFQAAGRMMGAEPAGIVVLEDSVPGCVAAKRAGMKVIAVPEGEWSGRGFEEVADLIVTDLAEASRRIRFNDDNC